MTSPEGATLQDRDSRNGTYVNGVRVTERIRISDGSAISFGTAEAVFHQTPLQSTQAIPASDPARKKT